MRFEIRNNCSIRIGRFDCAVVSNYTLRLTLFVDGPISCLLLVVISSVRIPNMVTVSPFKM